MTVAFLFAGQGSQTVGMGLDLYQNFPAARAVFQEVDEMLHQNLSRLMFQGDLAELTQTQNAQPAIMAVGMAVVRVLGAELGQPLVHLAHYMAGHSLGEYTALCAAGALSLSETAELLKKRGLAMARVGELSPGGMMAVLGLDESAVADIVREASDTNEAVFIANDNCPGQIIISGHPNALKRAQALAMERGAKRVVPLAVAGAFHSPLMQPAQADMQSVIETADIQAPSVPVIANVTAAPTTNPEEIRRQLLDQITGTVRWRESVDFMIGQGVDTFIECANGKVIAGLVRRMAPTATILSAGDSESVAEVLKHLSSVSIRH